MRRKAAKAQSQVIESDSEDPITAIELSATRKRPTPKSDPKPRSTPKAAKGSPAPKKRQPSHISLSDDSDNYNLPSLSKLKKKIILQDDADDFAVVSSPKRSQPTPYSDDNGDIFISPAKRRRASKPSASKFLSGQPLKSSRQILESSESDDISPIRHPRNTRKPLLVNDVEEDDSDPIPPPTSRRTHTKLMILTDDSEDLEPVSARRRPTSRNSKLNKERDLVRVSLQKALNLTDIKPYSDTINIGGERITRVRLSSPYTSPEG
jgi:hypothetical protein